MNLKEELAAFSELVAKKLPTDFTRTSYNEIERIAASGIMKTALKAGDKAIDFTLLDGSAHPISLFKLLKKGNVVVSFARGTWCPFCNLEFKALQRSLPEIQAGDATIIGISPQLPSQAKDFIAETGLEFPILYDKGNAVARQYGLAFRLSDEYYAAFKKVTGKDLVIQNGDESLELPMPATYIINQAGEIIYAFINPSWLERGDPEDYKYLLNQTVAQF